MLILKFERAQKRCMNLSNVFKSNVNTQILSFNESEDIGYSRPQRLSEISSENNMIKLAFLKFHEHTHTQLIGNSGDKMNHRYLLDDNFELIDNKNVTNSDADTLNAGESGNALEYFLFKDYKTLDKLMKVKKNLSPLNDINLLIQDNFEQLREIMEKLTKDVHLITSYDKNSEFNRKYKDKIEIINLKIENKSEIRLRDLDIEEIY